ncbi:hypothetical protein PRIPAC_97829 [Pristionchus pacificus]|uniref:Metalloendopeptidase n=1 Tax=Pristionchus pacificus TaxID=54126 RepID=A0A454XX64_PRIPA|nr:hypothetical protein PRIPAC_97829 [Pristionchus pacificus]|eukprot:PDM77419.1 metallopeptidase [Pristionchus pacificus]
MLSSLFLLSLIASSSLADSLLVNDEPVIMNDEVLKPVILNDEPVILNEEPKVVYDEPVMVDDEPVILNDQPEIVNDEPVLVDDEPVILNDEPVILNDEVNKDDVESIEKEMSREVEEEFSDKEHQDELSLLKKQFASAHSDNETYISIPTELDINTNHTELFEGDIDLSPEQWKVALDSDPKNPLRRRQALSSVTSMWQPMGAPVIPYTFQPGFPAQYQQVVRDAIAFWEQRTCAKFRLATPSDASAIVFNHNANGCSSSVGRRNQRQQLNLQAPGCMTVTIVAHELSHAFGTLHVQSRVDRDTYVQIDTTNIQKGMEHNFRMEPTGYSTYGLPYEFGSMQHYFPYAFAVNQQRPTIYARPAYQRFQGSMDGPRATFWDTVLINKMYKCTDKCPRQMACQNGGVTDGANCNKCFCPRGWTGTNCERRPSDAQTTNVAASAQTVKVEMTGVFSAFQEKLVVLQAPAGKRIEATVKSFGPYRFSMCRSVGLEIVPTTDTRTSGLRFCAQPNPSTPIVSDGNTMLLWLYRDANYPVTAEVSVRAV